MLITAAIVIYRQMQFIQKNNPGYDKSQVLNVTLPQNLHLDNNPQLIEAIKQDRQSSMLIFIFAVIAVIISALGLFGLSAFAAEQRTKEFGIRKILGATLGNIGILLSREFVKLIGVAIIIATPLAWWAMNKWLENFAYRIEIGWWAPVTAGTTALVIALAITSYHAFRASVANPVRSLRIL